MWKWIMLLCVSFATTLSAEINVLAFAGSVRENSMNKKLLWEAANLAAQMQTNVKVIDLKDYPIPLYDGDLEAREGRPANAKQLRQLMIQSDIILIASPEYNASIPAVLKNAIDWTSRGENGGGSREAFKNKSFIIMSTSPGGSGGARGLIHLRTILTDIGGIVAPQQIVVPSCYNAFDEHGQLVNPKIRKEIQQILQKTINSRK